MVESFLEVFMDGFSIFVDTFSKFLHYFKLFFMRCKEKDLTINWKKCHFMAKYDVTMEHVISNKEIEVHKQKTIW